jgi:hypothetical protein
MAVAGAPAERAGPLLLSLHAIADKPQPLRQSQRRQVPLVDHAGHAGSPVRRIEPAQRRAHRLPGKPLPPTAFGKDPPGLGHVVEPLPEPAPRMEHPGNPDKRIIVAPAAGKQPIAVERPRACRTQQPVELLGRTGHPPAQMPAHRLGREQGDPFFMVAGVRVPEGEPLGAQDRVHDASFVRARPSCKRASQVVFAGPGISFVPIRAIRYHPARFDNLPFSRSHLPWESERTA